MATKGTKKKARKSSTPPSEAGEYVREEIDLIRKGAHGARSAKQAIAIGLSKARRAGVKLPPPEKGKSSEKIRSRAKQDLEKGQSHPKKRPSKKRSEATLKALKREPKTSVSKAALSRQTRAAARKRTAAERSASAKKAAHTRAGRRH